MGIYTVGELDMYVQTSSIHRPGDIAWSNIKMDRDVYQHMLVDLVLPNIKKGMAATAGNIILPQDGAKLLLQEDGEVFQALVTELSGHLNAVKLCTQQAQSPDPNVNDIGFFNSLQSMYYMTSPKDSIQLIKMVDDAYENILLE
jgi:hypothetical protein